MEHGGSSGGYRTIISRFPTVHTSVVALCNRIDVNTTRLSHQVASIVLGSQLAGCPEPRSAGSSSLTLVDGNPRIELARAAGRYYSTELDATYELVAKGTVLTVRRPRGEVDTLSVSGPRTFSAAMVTYRFAPDSAGTVPSFTVDIGRARGIEFDRVPASKTKE